MDVWGNEKRANRTCEMCCSWNGLKVLHEWNSCIHLFAKFYGYSINVSWEEKLRKPSKWRKMF